jgi:hypothetical protein
VTLAERGSRIVLRRTARILGELRERGTTTVLPYPGDAGVTGIAAWDGSDGVLAAFPMPLGLYTVGLLAGPGGMPEIDELPAPAEPAGGVSWAHDDAGESATSKRAATGNTRTIEDFSKEEQLIYGAAGSAKRGWCARGIRTPDPVITN